MARESLEMADKNKEQCLEENCMPHATLKSVVFVFCLGLIQT
jgi:hypothetical protein